MTELPEKWRDVRGVKPPVVGVDTGLIPDPLTSLEAWARYWHHDLPELPSLEVWAEIRRLEAAIATGERHRWLTERLQVLNAEAERRRGGAK